jgi:hypothetical protein
MLGVGPTLGHPLGPDRYPFSLVSGTREQNGGRRGCNRSMPDQAYGISPGRRGDLGAEH